MQDYLSWWHGALALGLLTVLFRILTGRTLGVSGSWRKVAFWRQESRLDKAAQSLKQDESGAASALLAATMAEFGDAAVSNLHNSDTGTQKPTPRQSAAKAPVPWTAHLLFLIGLMGGGALWSLYTGNLHIQYQLSAIHSHISGSFSHMMFMLLVGGFLVGMGTQMAGGCSSGHGLSGCSNLSWSSMLATMIFFSTAVVVANLIKLVM